MTASVWRFVICPDCKALMRPSPAGPVCAACNTTGEGRTITQEVVEKEIVVLGDTDGTLPTTDDFPCPECGKREAYFVYRQTRAADEPTTIILQCVHCKNKWRKY